MNKRELALLERAFAAEVDAAVNHHQFFMVQTKSKMAEKLVDDGLLQKVSTRTRSPFPCTVEGYALTDAGRLAYCSSCKTEGE